MLVAILGDLGQIPGGREDGQQIVIDRGGGKGKGQTDGPTMQNAAWFLSLLYFSSST